MLMEEIAYMKKENPTLTVLPILYWLWAKSWAPRNEGSWCLSWRNSQSSRETDTQGPGFEKYHYCWSTEWLSRWASAGSMTK